MRKLTLVVIVLGLLLLSGSAPASAADAPGDTARSLISFSAGALVVQKPAEYGDSWSAFWLFDERAQSGWATPQGVVAPQTVVIELPERTQLERLEFDTGNVDGDGRGARDVDVEMSDTSATAGFRKIASVSLKERVDGQRFAVSTPAPGRWLRITVKNNHGASDYIELFDVRGYGKQLTETPTANVSGTYETNYGKFHVLQNGTSITGCYESGDGLLNGGVSRRVMSLTWSDPQKRGPATMVFSADGKQLFGLWWHEGSTDGTGGVWNGTKVSDSVGSCPHWSGAKGAAQQQMATELKDLGRTRVYGINFDTDSAVIKPESKAKLDEIVALVRSDAALKLRIEGHTDSTGGDAHNKTLSQQRADSVKAYLVGSGIEAARLATAGLGASQPVAGNDTETGRAQNRRVELAKQ